MEKEITPGQFRVMMLDVLQDVHDFCERTGLCYYLSYGTLLGAVRHHGFIPWDDDVDICMPRPDYDRFLAEYVHPYYQVISAANDTSYPLDFAKVHDTRTIVKEKDGDGRWGVFVDIWPMDGVPDEVIWKKTHGKIVRLRHVVANQRFTRKFPFSRQYGFQKNLMILIGRLFHPFISVNRILLKEDRIMKRYPIDRCRFQGCYPAPCPVLFDAASLSKRILLPFEDRVFYAPEKYDTWLRAQYGDYMTPPPEGQRVSRHGINAYWI